MGLLQYSGSGSGSGSGSVSGSVSAETDKATASSVVSIQATNVFKIMGRFLKFFWGEKAEYDCLPSSLKTEEEKSNDVVSGRERSANAAV